ncbi:hypothetical protein [Methylocapsa aurea]|jgi:hypothetical protein|uniref:hypothetical protein n=1 Tax=Methylocapsa aurea TaxID=663610 RepID=UPI003D1880D8
MVGAEATAVRLERPFEPDSIDGPQPAETYRQSIDEEKHLGPSLLARRHPATDERS